MTTRAFVAALAVCLTIGLAGPPASADITSNDETAPATTGSSSTAGVVGRAVKPRRGYVPETGGKFNNPMSWTGGRYVIERHIIKAIRHTPSNGHIRIAAYSFDRVAIARELIRARKRGVQIQILLNDHNYPPAQRMVRKVLGRNPTKANFIYKCQSGCRATDNEHNNLHSKFYLFSRTGRARHVVMLGSANLTLNAVRWQWNDLWTGVEQKPLFRNFVNLFDDMRNDYSTRQPYYTFCGGGMPECNLDKVRTYNHVFPRPSNAQDDVVLDILNDVKCLYRNKAGKLRRTVLRLSMHTMRGKRGEYIARKIRSMYADGCDFKVNYGLIGFHVKRIIGAPTSRGRIPLRSTGFDLNEDPLEIERYTHQKYLIIRGSWRGDRKTQIVFTGSSNWASLGASEDEIIFSVRGGRVVEQWARNWNFMWKPPYSRDAYTTTYTVNREVRLVDGRWRSVPVVRKVVTVEPDPVRGAGPHWEND